MKVKGESEVAQSCPTVRPHRQQLTRLLRPRDFSRQEYGSAVSLPSPTPSGQSLPKTKSGGWSNCSPSVLETTLPRHLEGGRNTVKLLSWMYAPQLLPETLCCFNAFVCVYENPFSSPGDGRRSSPLFMTESQLKIQSSF